MSRPKQRPPAPGTRLAGGPRHPLPHPQRNSLVAY
jgi:hypothetical protein